MIRPSKTTLVLRPAKGYQNQINIGLILDLFLKVPLGLEEVVLAGRFFPPGTGLLEVEVWVLYIHNPPGGYIYIWLGNSYCTQIAPPTLGAIRVAQP